MKIFEIILVSILVLLELFLGINFILDGRRIRKIIKIRMKLQEMERERGEEKYPLVIDKEDLKFSDSSAPYIPKKIRIKSFYDVPLTISKEELKFDDLYV